MFADKLTDIRYWTDRYAETFFAEKLGPKVQIYSDETWTAVYRALLWPRLKGEKIEIIWDELHELEDFNPAVYEFDNSVGFFCIPGLESIDTTVLNIPEGFTELTKHEEYIKNGVSFSGLTIGIFTNDEKKNTIIITNQCRPEAIHACGSFFSRYFKSYFEDNPLTATEIKLLKGLKKYSSTDFNAALSELAVERGVKYALTGAIVMDFEKGTRRTQYEAAKAECDNFKTTVERRREEYYSAIRELDSLMVKAEGLYSIMNSTQENVELKEFFENAKNVEVLKAENGTLELIVDSYLSTYDGDAFEDVFMQNDRIFENLPWSAENAKLLLGNIFNTDPRFRIRTCGYFAIEIGEGVCTNSNYDYGPLRKDRLPNPHYQRFACLGGYASEIDNLLRQGNLVAALRLCLTAVTCVNIHETMTFQPFLETLLSCHEKVLEDMDHNQYTPDQALALLKGEQE